jgi:hypothetical protein
VNFLSSHTEILINKSDGTTTQLQVDHSIKIQLLLKLSEDKMEVPDLKLRSLNTNHSFFLDFKSKSSTEIQINNQSLRFIKKSKNYFIQVHISSKSVFQCSEDFIIYPYSSFVTRGGILSFYFNEKKLVQTLEPLYDDYADLKLSEVWTTQKVSSKNNQIFEDLKKNNPKEVFWQISSLDDVFIKKLLRSTEGCPDGFSFPLELKHGMIFDIGNENFQLELKQ